jgi:hypothetical protein
LFTSNIGSSITEIDKIFELPILLLEFIEFVDAYEIFDLMTIEL